MSVEPEFEKLPDTMLRCARCGNPFEIALTPCMPFCSIRCQQVDLKHWFDESYSLPCEGSEDLPTGPENDPDVI